MGLYRESAGIFPSMGALSKRRVVTNARHAFWIMLFSTLATGRDRGKERGIYVNYMQPEWLHLDSHRMAQYLQRGLCAAIVTCIRAWNQVDGGPNIDNCSFAIPQQGEEKLSCGEHTPVVDLELPL